MFNSTGMQGDTSPGSFKNVKNDNFLSLHPNDVLIG